MRLAAATLLLGFATAAGAPTPGQGPAHPKLLGGGGGIRGGGGGSSSGVAPKQPQQHGTATADLDEATVDVKTRFAAFAHQFNKDYESAAARDKAFATFAANDAKIAAHNAQGLSYTLGHNEFSDMSADEFHAAYIGSYLDNPALAREPDIDATLLDPEVQAAAPKSVDWVTMGAVTPVKSQGQCGSCWAFSTVMAVEGAFALLNDNNDDTGGGNDADSDGALVSLSEQDLVSCDDTNQGCSGGLMDAAFEWVEKNGLCTEEAYPYAAGNGAAPACRTACTPAVTVTGFQDVPSGDEAALLSAVARQPVSVAIEADRTVFQLYKGGVIKASEDCGDQLDHGVGIVGYGTAADGTDYWKLKNSWGASWGLRGYVLLERGHDTCGVSQSASYPTGAKRL